MKNPQNLLNNNLRTWKKWKTVTFCANLKLDWTTKETGGNDLQCVFYYIIFVLNWTYVMLWGVAVQDETWWFYNFR